MARHNEGLGSINDNILDFRGIEFQVPSVRRTSTSTHRWQFCQIKCVLCTIGTDLVEKPSGDTSTRLGRNKLFILVNPIKFRPILSVTCQELKTRNGRAIGVGGRSVFHSCDSKLKYVQERGVFHGKVIDPFESLWFIDKPPDKTLATS